MVGRHLFPRVYHKVDKMKLFSAGRRVSQALAMVRLPSNYPYQMYNAVAGGQQRCTIMNQTASVLRIVTGWQVLRIVTGWHTLPSAQPLTSGWVGIDLAAVVMICQFPQGYHKQLRHASAMVHRSTQHGLYEVMQCFHPDMPCVHRGL